MTTVYSDIILTEQVILASGVRGRNERRNQRAVNQAGFMSANVVWQQTLRRFELGTVPMSPELWAEVEGVFEATDGGAYGFLIFDPKDRSADTSSGKLLGYTTVNIGSIGVGAGVPSYRLHKLYTAASRTKARRISRPKQSIVVTRGGSPVTEGVSAGNIAINYDTGTVTFVADASENMTSITVGGTTVLNFASGAGVVAALAVSDRVYLTGVTGTAASVLNGTSHPITVKGASSLTISTSTAGLTATNGTAAAYPQPDEGLAWSGDFYVPVQFESDALDWELARTGAFDDRLIGSSTMLVEVRE